MSLVFLCGRLELTAHCSTKISSRTLIHEGILPYTFASCPALLQPFKAAHLALLEMLRNHRHNVSVDIYGNFIRVLLLHCSDCLLNRSDTSVARPSIKSIYHSKERRRDASGYHEQTASSTSQESQSTERTISQIPTVECRFHRQPFARADLVTHAAYVWLTLLGYLTADLAIAPPSNPVRCQRSDDPRVRRSLYRRKPVSLLVARVSRSRSRSPRTFQNPKQAQENIAPSAFIQRPMRRHFGIFCGAKKSVVRQEQRESRSRTSRPVPKE